MPINTRSQSRNRSPTPDVPPGPEDEQENPIRHESAVPPEDAPNLAEAIILMTEAFQHRDNKPRANTKVKVPDTFDGTDPKKLNNFILLCNLYFRNNPSYDDDELKVTFALSYLRGTALEYFEPAILDSDEAPEWMYSWSGFISTLRTEFGPIDPTADAEDGIDNLKMQDNQHIVKYNVEFNRLAIRTGWDNSVLRHRYYSGLAERIKDIMGQQGKPATLAAMKTLAHAIDSRHWERLREKSRSGKSKSDDKSDKPDSKIDNASKSEKKGGNSGSGSGNGNHNRKKGKPDSGNKSSSSGTSASISDKLGKDGKLTHQERQRRFDNNLCMFCGGVGHVAKDCPKSTSSASKAKGRAAQAKEKTKESSDSKKD
jgi:hypothetical protein